MSNELDEIFALLNDAFTDRCRVEEFQRKLGPALYRLPSFGKAADRKLDDFVNRMELVIFSQRPEDQLAATRDLARDLKNELIRIRSQRMT